MYFSFSSYLEKCDTRLSVRWLYIKVIWTSWEERVRFQSWSCPTLQPFTFSSCSALAAVIFTVTPLTAESDGPTAILHLFSLLEIIACKSDY